MYRCCNFISNLSQNVLLDLEFVILVSGHCYTLCKFNKANDYFSYVQNFYCIRIISMCQRNLVFHFFPPRILCFPPAPQTVSKSFGSITEDFHSSLSNHHLSARTSPQLSPLLLTHHLPDPSTSFELFSLSYIPPLLY